jgi:hypothetical protein
MGEINTDVLMDTVLGMLPLLAHSAFVQVRKTFPLGRHNPAGAQVGKKMVTL